MAISGEGGNKDTKQKSLVAENKPQVVTLADGKEYNLAPLDLNILVEFEETFDGPLSELISSGKMKYLRHLIYLMLREEYSLDEKEVGKLLTIKVFGELNL